MISQLDSSFYSLNSFQISSFSLQKKIFIICMEEEKKAPQNRVVELMKGLEPVELD